MQNFFESSSKQSSSPPSPQHDTSTRPDCNGCTDWQPNLQHQKEEASSWKRDGHGCYDCYDGGVYNMTPDHVVEGFRSYHQSAWKDDGNQHNSNGDFHGVVADVQNYDVACEEKTHTKDANKVFNHVLLSPHPHFLDSGSVHLVEDPAVYLPERPTLSEHLNTFPNLRRLLLNGLKIKGEYHDSDTYLLKPNVLKEEVNGDEGDFKQSLPHTLSSCVYGENSANVQKLSINTNACYPACFDSSTNFQNELTSNVVAGVNSISCTTSCVTLLSDQMVYPLKQTFDSENDVNHETVPTDSPIAQDSVNKKHALLDVSNGKHKTGEATVGDSLRHAVRQAIGMLSSDQLHLLDEAICSVLPNSRVRYC